MRRRLFHALCLGVTACLCAASAWAGLADTVVRVKPSVVLVGTFRTTDNPRFQLRGAGFLVARGDMVVTNAHVLPPDGDEGSLVVQVRVGQGDWQMRTATVLETDVARDLTLLRVSGAPGPALKIGDSRRVREGDDLAFMGFPIGGSLGFSHVTHRATVSTITSAALPSPSAERLREQAIRSLRNGTFDIFQLDATAYPGNSGGPLFDPDTGDVMGVMNMVLIKNTRESALSQPSGISYAIPARYVQELVDRHR
ncbi:MAG: trypsin-like peptidase domain-containing protein [Hydrogenophaga sp.]|jgi:serine protease Do|uniref:S1C family serine protease n=1 Tax=Hydrogenophaga sp. TaxID=1904254 RepID=UPI0026124614|nr:serine protease [Hydrogenophaga sp.]MCW5672440.1 trypsin-like peptidase domain-containing protein [Hydrogenophaga sp.]